MFELVIFLIFVRSWISTLIRLIMQQTDAFFSILLNMTWQDQGNISSTTRPDGKVMLHFLFPCKSFSMEAVRITMCVSCHFHAGF